MFVMLTLGIFLVALSGSLVGSTVYLFDRLPSFRMRKDPFRTISYLLSDYLFCNIREVKESGRGVRLSILSFLRNGNRFQKSSGSSGSGELWFRGRSSPIGSGGGWVYFFLKIFSGNLWTVHDRHPFSS